MKTARFVWATLVGVCLFSGFLLISAWLLPYPVLDSWLDRLSRDGNAGFFTLELFSRLRPPLLLAALITMGAGVVLVVQRSRAIGALQSLSDWLGVRWARLAADSNQFLSHLRLSRLPACERFLLAVLILLAAWVRLQDISHPMGYDESYTYVNFASKPIAQILSDYHLPNNHVFHSLLVHASTRLFGSQPWAVRMPAYLAGVLMVPGVYFLARKLYNSTTALASASLAAAAPWLIQFSVDARGYTLVALLTMAAYWLAAEVMRQRNRLAWVLLVVASGLGFFTIPIMVYPFGAILSWLLLSCLQGDFSPQYQTRKVFLTYVAAAAVATALFTLLLYMPILVVSGSRSLFANPFVGSWRWHEFLYLLQIGSAQTWRDGFLGVPAWMVAVAVGGFFASLVLHRHISGYKFPTQLATLGWISLALLVQRPDILSKVWFFLFPLFLMWSAAGLVVTLERIPLPSRWGIQPAELATTAIFVAICGLVAIQSFRHPLDTHPAPEGAELTAIHLKEVLQPEDIISVAVPIDAPLGYYTQVYGIPSSQYYRPKDTQRNFEFAFLVVSTQHGQTLQGLLDTRGPDPSRLDLSAARVESDFGPYTVYRVPAANRK